MSKTTVPPLLCSTPPPIDDFGDCDDKDDDFGGFETADVDFVDDTSLPRTPRHESRKKSETETLDLPVPPADDIPIVFKNNKINAQTVNNENDRINEEILQEIPANENNITVNVTIPSEDSLETSKAVNQCNDVNFSDDDDENSIECKSKLNTNQQTHSYRSSRANSPQSLELIGANLSADEDNESLVEFQAASEQKYDDNTSLPSLNFDSVSISKSATPISHEDDKTQPNESPTLNVFDQPDVEQSNMKIVIAECIEDKEIECKNSSCEEKESENIVYKTEDNFVEVTIDNNSDRNISISDDEDDEFADFASAIVSSENTKCTEIKPNIEKFSFKETNQSSEDIDSPIFDADFSQFDVNFSTSNIHSSDILNQNDNQENVIKKSSVLENFVDDVDNEDFQDFSSAATMRKLHENHNQKENDDDFGDFNDFQTSTVSTTEFHVKSMPIINFDERIKTILDLMFPKSDEIQLETSSKAEDLDNVLTRNLKDLDTSTAFKYQWSLSNMKHSLIKSLGIDSRNVLFGEKWNSSMPRFAANLGFSPLEPIKPMPTKSSSTGNITSDIKDKIQSTSSNSIVGDVPAVQFDWNTSGLVNPLDASHAHTLLLDLDQLVVVANLDKINLDSSSSPCTATNLTTLTTTTTTTTTPTTTSTTTTKSSLHTSANNICDAQPQKLLLNNFLINKKLNNIERNSIVDFSLGDGTKHNANNFGDGLTAATVITSINKYNSKYIIYATNSQHIGYANETKNVDLFDQYLDSRVKEILHERKTEEIHTPESIESDASDTKCGEQSEQQIQMTIGTEETVSGDVDRSTTTDSKTDNNTAHLPNVSIDNSLTNDLTSSADEKISPDEIQQTILENHHRTTPTTYVVPVPLKETHIFTPIKGENSISRSIKSYNSKCPIDFDYEMAAAGIIIDETVVKKEYRDIEYNPEKLALDSDRRYIHDDKRFECNAPPKWINDGKNLNSFHELAGTTAAEIPFSEPTISNDLTNNSFDDEFTDFQSVSVTIPTQKTDEKIKSRNDTPTLIDERMILSPAVLLPQSVTMDTKPKIDWPEPGIDSDELARLEQMFPQKMKTLSSQNCVKQSHEQLTKIGKNDDDDWSDFISVPVTQQSSTVTPSITSVSGSIKLSPKKQRQTVDDDDWSDFVSSAPHQSTLQSTNQQQYQNIGNTWNSNPMPTSQVNVWQMQTPYYSNSTLALSSQLQIKPNQFNSVPTYHINSNINQNHVYDVSFSSLASSKNTQEGAANPANHHQSTFNSLQQQQSQPNQNNVLKSQLNQNRTPNIALIPDLGFVACKNVIKISRNNFPSKK